MSGPDHSLLDRFAAESGLPDDASLQAIVASVHAIPYGRASGRTADAVIESGRGTCSTKHYLLSALVEKRRPRVGVSMVHRVYRLEPTNARRLFGPVAAAAVPPDGLVDVHTYLLLDQDGAPSVIDITFPRTPRWDGVTPMAVQCGPGTDHIAGADPDALKSALVAQHCDPARREPFIAALSL